MARRWHPSRSSRRGVFRQPSTRAFRPRRPPVRSKGTGAGTGTIALTFTLAGAGTPNLAGTGTLAVTLTLAGSGSGFTGIGLPPRRRVRWQFVVGPAAGGHELALTEAHSRRVTFRLTDSTEMAFQLDDRHPQAEAIDELATDLHILWTPRDGGPTRIMQRGRIGPTTEAGTDRAQTIDVIALDYRAVLARRTLYTGDTLTYAATDQAEIAWGLISSTQARAGGNLGIAKDWTGTTPTGVNRDRTYEASDAIGARVQELSEVIDGFDWAIESDSASELKLRIWYPQRGTDRGVILEAGGLVSAWKRDVDPSGYANALRYTGSAEAVLTAQELEAADLAGRAEGRWDAVFGDDSLLTQSSLNDRATWQLARSQVLQPVYSLTLRQGAWDGPDHIWLGDPVRLIIRRGARLTDTVLRVYEMAFTLGESGEESLVITVGGPRPNFRKRASLIEQRLKALERR